MKNVIKIILLLVTCILFSACSDESNNSSAEANKDHVWKSQTDSIEKAKEVEAMMMDATEKTREAIEDQN